MHTMRPKWSSWKKKLSIADIFDTVKIIYDQPEPEDDEDTFDPKNEDENEDHNGNDDSSAIGNGSKWEAQFTIGLSQ